MVSVSSVGRPWSVSCLRPSPPMRFRDDKTSRNFKKTSKYTVLIFFTIYINILLTEIVKDFGWFVNNNKTMSMFGSSNLDLFI